MGRLGNQMFQYAAVKGIATHKKYWYSVPNNSDIFNCFKLPQTLTNQNKSSINVDKFEFDEYFFNNCPDDIDLIGYFQSEKYFKHIENQIRIDFTFKDEILKTCLNNKIFNDNVISLHVRRGDYLIDPNFECLSLNYYYDALRLLPDVPVMVFSDDFEWCKKNFTESRFAISTNNYYIDLCMMTLCKYHIIANSSFSWWGSWLAKSKQTIAPKKWFCGEYLNWNTKDLYLDDWILL